MAERTLPPPPAEVEAHPDEHEGLARTFHEKVISLDTMGVRLLGPTAVAIAIIVVSAVLLATRDAGWPLVSAGAVSGSVLGTVPLPVAVVTTLTVVLAWSFILAGALHAHLALRIVALAAYAFVGLNGAILSGSIVAGLVIVLAVFSVLVAATGLYVTDRGNHRQAPHLHHRVRLRLPTFGWILFATALIYGVFALAGLRNGDLVRFIDGELLTFQFLLIPVLLLAGTDFAEWAEVVSGRLSSLVERLPRWALVGALGAAAIGILLWAYVFRAGPGFSLLGTLLGLAPVAALAIPVCGAAALALRRPTSTRVPFWALAAGALLVYLGLLLPGIVSPSTSSSFSAPVLPPLVSAQSTRSPSYSLLVPQTWSRMAIDQGSLWAGSADGRPARLVLLWNPAPTERSLSTALAAPVTLGSEGSSEGWRTGSLATSLRGQPARGEYWTQRVGGVAWTLAGVRAGGLSESSRALFETTLESFSASSDAGQENSSSDLPSALVIWEGGAALILVAGGLALLLAGRGESATGGLFLTLAGLFALAGAQVLPTLVYQTGVRSLEAVVPFNVNLGAAYATLGAIALTSVVPGWRLPVPILRLILVLILGFAALDVLFEGVFGTALDAGERFTVLQGVFLVVAMLWDVLMSGESFTNTGGPAVPRHTRVLLYLGYTLLVVTTVLFLSAVQVQGGGSAGQQFESDIWPQVGIATLGPPLLITFFLVNLAAWRRARPLPRADGLDQVDRSILDEVGVG